jgi:hypothetical protein
MVNSYSSWKILVFLTKELPPTVHPKVPTAAVVDPPRRTRSGPHADGAPPA